MQGVIICLAAGLIAVVCLLVWRWWRIARELAGGLDELRREGRAHFVRAGTTGLLGPLVRRFNGAAAEVQARIDRLEGDRSQLLVVLGAMAEAVISVDPRQRLLYANAGANRLFGLDLSSVGRLVPELIRSPRVQEAVEATLRLKSPRSYQAEFVISGREAFARVQPAERHLAVHGTPLPGLPSPGAVLVFHDVTELRRLERMRQDFVANASHELKTPLASIKAYTETLLDWALRDDSVNVRFLERIDEQAERLNQLILDLLSLARLESGQGIFDHQPLDVVLVLEASIDSHRGRASAKNLVLTFDSDELEPGTMILADEEAVRQIADNLIDNAIKYTPQDGSVSVRCSLDGDDVAVEVADTGIGIPREDLPRIFERFYRVDKARSRELGVTGLGLSIVKHLVQSIGGRIDVTSRLGSGSRFTVRFPRPRPSGMGALAARMPVEGGSAAS
jgi:two-component system phosphate regulon sensor histidine kinase PhoR